MKRLKLILITLLVSITTLYAQINFQIFESENMVEIIPKGREVDIEWKEFIFLKSGEVFGKSKLSPYAISRYEVTQSLYQNVMGVNSSRFKGNQLPVETVTWYDAVFFCNELTKITLGEKNCCYSITNIKKDGDGNIIDAKVAWDKSKKGYRLPTSPEWEYAARGGDKGGWDYVYSGTNNYPEDVAWCGTNSNYKTHTVGTKKPNMAGLYDMSGNVWEWCWDERNYISYGVYELYDTPISYYNNRSLRGGCYNSSDPGDECSISDTSTYSPSRKSDSYGFRICRSLDTPVYSYKINLSTFESENMVEIIPKGQKETRYYDLTGEEGHFYSIGKYEVTQEFYRTVIGADPSKFKGDELPVENITWYDAVFFCNELTKITMGEENCCYTITNIEWDVGTGRGIKDAKVTWNKNKKGYRLPTEAEWEFAARGGDKGGWYYEYSGSDDIDEVAWYYSNSYNRESGNSETHNVGTKQANLAGLYDMSGNVCEWCWSPWSDGSSARVIRGGSCNNDDDGCTVSSRDYYNPSIRNYLLGFRVCRSLDAEKMKSVSVNHFENETFESENMVKIIPEEKEVDFEWKDFIFKAGGVVENTIITKLTSYAIGRYEVTQSLYQKVMGNNPSQFKGEKLPVENVTWYDAVYFCNELTKITMGEKNCCYSITNVVKNKDGNIIEAKVTWDDSKKGYRLPTSQEWEYAARGGDKGGWDYYYSGSDDMEEVAWYIFNSDGKTHDVGTKQANKAGIYDMTGNVSEWCWNTWNEDSSDRVERGGSYYTGDDFDSFQCTVSYPLSWDPSYGGSTVGFRICQGL